MDIDTNRGSSSLGNQISERFLDNLKEKHEVRFDHETLLNTTAVRPITSDNYFMGSISGGRSRGNKKGKSDSIDI
jgi:hypothetical protein